MRQVIMSIIFVLCASSIHAQSPQTYYIDYAGGSNSNNGTSSSTPWKSHPYMQNAVGCAGAPHAYSHVAGDRFIFKGGVTWPFQCFGMDILLTGSSSSVMDGYDVDVTWFSGGSFTRPIFDLANNVPTVAGPIGGHNVINVESPSFVNINQIEIKRQGIVGGFSGPNIGHDCGVYFAVGGAGNVTNSFFHDWAATTTAIQAGWSNCAGGVGNANQVAGDTFSAQNSTDLTLASHVSFGGCSHNHAVMFSNRCLYAGQGALGYGNAHDNEFGWMSDQGATGLYAGNGIHTNVIENTWTGPSRFYNNWIHDVSSIGVVMLVCSSDIVVNNVIERAGGVPQIAVDPGGVCSSSGTATVEGNTVDCSQGVLCFRTTLRTGATIPALLLKNNLWISNGNPVCYNNPSAGCNNVVNVNASNNITMSSATANAQGITDSGKYALTAATNTPVGQGADVSSQCGTLPFLCSDVSGAFWTGLGGYKARPVAPDVGAYMFAGGVQPAKPSPPSNVLAVVQ